MLKVFKIGGNIVDNSEKLDKFLTDFANIPGDKILVHGGGKIATTISKALGIETNMINGRRVTDKQTLRVVTMVYAGIINKTIVASLQDKGCNAIGLSGADGVFIRSRRRSPVPVDYGWVGDPESINSSLAEMLINAGYAIVAAPITYAPDAGVLNTNADTVAQTIATGMAATGRSVELVYCFEKQGVLRDVNDENSVISSISQNEFASLRENGIVSDGMLPKLENAFKAIECGVEKVVICSAENISRPSYGGTVLSK